MFSVLYKLQSRLMILRKIIIRKIIKIFFLLKIDTESLTCCNSAAKQTGTVFAGLTGNGFNNTRCQDYVPLKDSVFKPSSSMLANIQKDQTER